MSLKQQYLFIPFTYLTMHIKQVIDEALFLSQ